MQTEMSSFQRKSADLINCDCINIKCSVKVQGEGHDEVESDMPGAMKD